MVVTADGYLRAGNVNALKGITMNVVTANATGAGFLVETGNALGGYGIQSRVTNSTTKALSVQNLSNEKFYVTGDGQGYFATRIGIGTIPSSFAVLALSHNDSHGGIALNRNSDSSGKSQISFRQLGLERWAIGTDLNQDNSNNFFIYGGSNYQTQFFINTDGKIGFGTTSPTERLDVNGAIKLGNTLNPTPQPGTLRYNIATNNFEGYNGSWKPFISSAVWQVNSNSTAYYNDGSVEIGTNDPTITNIGAKLFVNTQDNFDWGYSFLSRTVAIIIDSKTYDQGIYNIIWDISHLPKGIYFYSLKGSDKSSSGKLIKF